MSLQPMDPASPEISTPIPDTLSEQVNLLKNMIEFKITGQGGFDPQYYEAMRRHLKGLEQLATVIPAWLHSCWTENDLWDHFRTLQTYQERRKALRSDFEPMFGYLENQAASLVVGFNLLVATDRDWEQERGPHNWDWLSVLSYRKESHLREKYHSNLELLTGLPCIFASSFESGKPVYIGHLTRIRPRQADVRINYILTHKIAEENTNDFWENTELMRELDIEDAESSGSHWAVKEEDLAEIFQRLNVRLEPLTAPENTKTETQINEGQQIPPHAEARIRISENTLSSLHIIEQLEKAPAGIGHNQPPEPIAELPEEVRHELNQIKTVLTEIQESIGQTSPDKSTLQEQSNRLSFCAKWLKKRMTKATDAFLTVFAKGLAGLLLWHLSRIIEILPLLL